MFVVNKWYTILHHYANQGPKSVLGGATCFSEGSLINHHFITVLLQKGNMQPL